MIQFHSIRRQKKTFSNCFYREATGVKNFILLFVIFFLICSICETCEFSIKIVNSSWTLKPEFFKCNRGDKKNYRHRHLKSYVWHKLNKKSFQHWMKRMQYSDCLQFRVFCVLFICVGACNLRSDLYRREKKRINRKIEILLFYAISGLMYW